ncbi:MAG TPA: DUF2190 family protein [Candidatus Competibacteraceae bacterium]|nr:DUF2190 family protein [Candidatus Competibacteraceae bacterium]
MAVNYIQPGEVLTYTNATGSDIAAGRVVKLGATEDCTLAVALVDIANGAAGEVRRCGVFTVPKVSAAVFAQGESLIWDSSAGAFDDNQATPASGDVSGSVIAAAAGANTETTCKALFLGIPGTLTA